MLISFPVFELEDATGQTILGFESAAECIMSLDIMPDFDV
jgi:hypothetical protein